MAVDLEILQNFGKNNKNPSESTSEVERRHKIIWFNVITGSIMHMIAIYGIFLVFTRAHIFTTLQIVLLYFIGNFGITAGLHRLWSHRSYKAKWPLRLILMILSTISFQGTIYQWCRDHRVHHKCSDTDGDPHNINSGFFFAHLGWLLSKKFSDVLENGSKLDLQDLLDDPIVRFQKKYVHSLVTLLAVILPTQIPMMLWGETFVNAFCLNMLRYFLTLHTTLSINSFTHMMGLKPYDKNIYPTENEYISFFALGEGFHNYHHTFPWDYRASEFVGFSFNITSVLINQFAKIGWAYNLKMASDDMIKKRCLISGDGTHDIWGWGDKDQPSEDFEEATIMYRKMD